MTDDETRDVCHGLALRLERHDATIDGAEQAFSDVRTDMRGRLKGVESRLQSKAGNGVQTWPQPPLHLCGRQPTV
jgi:hypothetical protein